MRTIRNLPQMNGQENTGFLPIKRRRKGAKFNPDRNYLKIAVAEYLAGGGKITMIELVMTDQAGIDQEATHKFLFGDPGHIIARNYPEGFWG